MCSVSGRLGLLYAGHTSKWPVSYAHSFERRLPTDLSKHRRETALSGTAYWFLQKSAAPLTDNCTAAFTKVTEYTPCLTDERHSAATSCTVGTDAATLRPKRSLQSTTDQVKMHVWKIDQMSCLVWKINQLLSLYIAVSRFLKCTLSLDRFLKHALSFDRFFIGGIARTTETAVRYRYTTRWIHKPYSSGI